MMDSVVEYVQQWSGFREILIGTAAMVLAILGRKTWNWARTPGEISERAQKLLDYIQSEETYQEALYLTPKACSTKKFDFRYGKIETRENTDNLLKGFSWKEQRILRKASKKLCREIAERDKRRASAMALHKIDQLLQGETKEVKGTDPSPFHRS